MSSSVRVDVIEFWIPFAPLAKSGLTLDPKTRSVRYTKPYYADYEKRMRAYVNHVLKHRGHRWDADLWYSVDLHYYMPVNRRGNIRRADIDNLTKAVFDSLNRILWNDDSQIFEMYVHRDSCLNSPRRKRPGTVICVESYVQEDWH
jgi:Holliday junction resolvase RusA-like endonuclease